MNKIDITIGRSMGIQPRQFESIKPTVSITFKDVDIDKLDEKATSMLDVVSDIFKLEFASEYFQYSELKSKGLEQNYNDIVTGIDKLLSDIKEETKIVLGN